MDSEVIILSKVNQTMKDKCSMIPFLCGIKKKLIQMNLQNRNIFTYIENKLMVTRWKKEVEE